MGLYERIRSILQDTDGIIVIESESKLKKQSNYEIVEFWDIRIRYKTGPKKIFEKIPGIREIPFCRKKITNLENIKGKLGEELKINPISEITLKPKTLMYSHLFINEGRRWYELVRIIES